VVAQIRREFPKGTRVGHAGTLDPFATGLLIVLVGRASRTQQFFMGLDKEYLADARFGAVSDTLDRDGQITETGEVPLGDLDLPVGDLEQIPPRFSALHIAGKRAHQLAREGVEFELAPRAVRVESFDEISRDQARRSFRIRCGSGTYVRSLVADLGDAYCEELRRTAIGPFRLDDSFTVSEPEALDLGEALSAVLPPVTLTEPDAVALANGRRVEFEEKLEGPAVVFGPEGLVAVAELNSDGLLTSSVGFVG